MATLSTAARDAIWKSVMSGGTCNCLTGSMTKAQIKDAVVDVDDWLATKVTAIDEAFDAAALSGMSQQARWRLLAFVVSQRAESEVF